MNEKYIIDSEGRKRKAQEVICETCGKPFLKPERFVKKYLHNFCCKNCANNFRKIRIKVKCSMCNKEFEITPKRFKNSKSGLFFCCKKCKDEAQKIKYGLKQIQPKHYGISDRYQKICFKHHPHKCCICGEENIVACHHYDGNHNNNDICNLVPLCPTHHSYWHSKFRNLIQDKVDEYVKNFINKNNGLLVK